MDDGRILDASRLTANYTVDRRRGGSPITNESNGMIADGMFRQPLLCEQEEDDHEREVKSTCVNIGPALHQSSSRAVGADAPTTPTTRQRRACNEGRRGSNSQGGDRFTTEVVKETPVARMLRYLESLPPDRPIGKELTEFSLWKSVRTEFIATLVFVIVSLGASMRKCNIPADPLTGLSSGIASGLITAILMYLTSNQIPNYTSCHLNPCITLSLLISRHHDSRQHRRVSPVRFLLFAAAQLLASITASCILQGLVFNHESSAMDPGCSNSSFILESALPQPVRGMHESNVFGFEFLAAFLVTITYFAVTDERKVRRERSRKRFAESMIQSSAGRRRIQAGRSSHGNEEGSGRGEEKAGELVRKPSQEVGDNNRQQRRGNRGNSSSSRKHRLSNNCHLSGGRQQQEKLSAACTHQAAGVGTATGERRQAHTFVHPATTAQANVIPSAVGANSPSSFSSPSTSSCTASTNSSCCTSVSSTSLSGKRAERYDDRHDWDGGYPGRFEYVGFAVTAAHLFTVYWVASLLGSIFAAFTYEYIKSSKPDPVSLPYREHNAPSSSSSSRSNNDGSVGGRIVLSPSGLSFAHIPEASPSNSSSTSSPSSSSCSDQDEDGEGNNEGAVCRNSGSRMKMSDSGEANDPQSNGREVRGGIDERAGPRLRGPGSRTRKRSPDKGVKKAACTPSSSSLFDHDQPVGGSEKLTRGEDASSCHQQKSQHQQRSPSSATILSVTHLPLNQRPEEGMTEMTFISPADDIRYPPDQIRR